MNFDKQERFIIKILSIESIIRICDNKVDRLIQWKGDDSIDHK